MQTVPEKNPTGELGNFQQRVKEVIQNYKVMAKAISPEDAQLDELRHNKIFLERVKKEYSGLVEILEDEVRKFSRQTGSEADGSSLSTTLSDLQEELLFVLGKLRDVKDNINLLQDSKNGDSQSAHSSGSMILNSLSFYTLNSSSSSSSPYSSSSSSPSMSIASSPSSSPSSSLRVIKFEQPTDHTLETFKTNAKTIMNSEYNKDTRLLGIVPLYNRGMPGGETGILNPRSHITYTIFKEALRIKRDDRETISLLIGYCVNYLKLDAMLKQQNLSKDTVKKDLNQLLGMIHSDESSVIRKYIDNQIKINWDVEEIKNGSDYQPLTHNFDYESSEKAIKKSTQVLDRINKLISQVQKVTEHRDSEGTIHKYIAQVKKEKDYIHKKLKDYTDTTKYPLDIYEEIIEQYREILKQLAVASGELTRMAFRITDPTPPQKTTFHERSATLPNFLATLRGQPEIQPPKFDKKRRPAIATSLTEERSSPPQEIQFLS